MRIARKYRAVKFEFLQEAPMMGFKAFHSAQATIAGIESSS
jgi:hypothetical protein